jgi:ATP-dependent protease HslVU (ClpYQ) peptidase subunit
MTAVVGVVEDGRICIGADSAGTTAWGSQVLYAWPKIWRQGPYLIGICGSGRARQVLQYHADLPVPWEWEQDLVGFLVARFVPEVRRVLKDEGLAEKENNVESFFGDFMVGFRGRLFTIESTFQVLEVAHGYDAIGSGMDVARGAMCATVGAGCGRERVLAALEAAARHCSGVRPPFHIEVLE